jgi:multiple sugar transport system substrate-binding protein
MKKRTKVIVLIPLLIVFSIILFFQNRTHRQQSKILITIIGENTSTIQAMMSVEEEYEKENPSVDLAFKPNTFDDAFNKINQDLSNHTGLYDIVMQYNFSLSSFVRNNYVYKPSELIKDIPQSMLEFEKDLFEKTWKTVGFYYNDFRDPSKGLQKAGYPYVANSILLMYNKQMFCNPNNKVAFRKKHGRELLVPKTWEEYYAVAEFFTNKKVNTYGVCLEGASGSFLYFEFANYLHSMGGKVLDKGLGWEGDAKTEVVLNSPEALRALTFFRSLKPFNNGNFTDVEQFKQMEIMKEGKTAMALSWEDVISLNIQNDSSFTQRFGFEVIPGDKSVIGGGAFFVNRDSRHPEEAFKFILYLLQPKTQRTLALKGLSTPLMSVYDDPDVQKDPHMLPLKESLTRGGIYLEAGPDADMISETLSNYIQKVWRDEITAQDALRQASEEISYKRANIYEKLR